jgi:hypothetical protein
LLYSTTITCTISITCSYTGTSKPTTITCSYAGASKPTTITISYTNTNSKLLNMDIY